MPCLVPESQEAPSSSRECFNLEEIAQQKQQNCVVHKVHLNIISTLNVLFYYAFLSEVSILDH